MELLDRINYLKRELPTLYNDANDIKTLASFSGLPVQHLDFTESASNIWNSVIDKAIHLEKLSDIGMAVIRDYPNRKDILENINSINLESKNNKGIKVISGKSGFFNKSTLGVISLITGLLSAILTILGSYTHWLPILNYNIEIVLVISTLILVFGAFYIFKTTPETNRDSVQIKNRKLLSGLSIFLIPVLAFTFYFTNIRLTKKEIQERDKFIKLGDYYFNIPNHRQKAIKPYREALKIDPRMPEIVEKIKSIR